MSLPSARSIAGDLAFCLGFFTRLPVAMPPHRRLAGAIWAAPLAGLAIGALSWLAFASASRLGLPSGAAAALALAASVVLTGALHEDGLADTVDGFGGGRTRERKLEIMRDSRIGTYGALALGLALLLRWTSLAAFPQPGALLAPLLAAHAASRAMLPLYMATTVSARVEGLAASAGSPSSGVVVAALCIGAATLLLAGLNFGMIAALAVSAVTILFRQLSIRQIGGHTGDTTGALQQLGEIIVLLVAASLAP